MIASIRDLAISLAIWVHANPEYTMNEALVEVARSERVALSRVQYALTFAQSEYWVDIEGDHLLPGPVTAPAR